MDEVPSIDLGFWMKKFTDMNRMEMSITLPQSLSSNQQKEKIKKNLFRGGNKN